MYKSPENLPSCFHCVVFFIFRLFEENVVQRSQVFVNEEVTVRSHIIDAQLFFGSKQEELLATINMIKRAANSNKHIVFICLQLLYVNIYGCNGSK